MGQNLTLRSLPGVWLGFVQVRRASGLQLQDSSDSKAAPKVGQPKEGAG